MITKERGHLLITRGLERFSYWGMFSILILYLIMEEFHQFNDEAAKDKAYQVKNLFLTVLIFSPFLGGLLGDILREPKKVIFLGAGLFILGSMGIWWAGKNSELDPPFSEQTAPSLLEKK